MWFDTIVSIHVRHDIICFKLGKCLTKCPWFLSDRVIPWIALASSRSKKRCSWNIFWPFSFWPGFRPTQALAHISIYYCLQSYHLLQTHWKGLGWAEVGQCPSRAHDQYFPADLYCAQYINQDSKLFSFRIFDSLLGWCGQKLSFFAQHPINQFKSVQQSRQQQMLKVC